MFRDVPQDQKKKLKIEFEIVLVYRSLAHLTSLSRYSSFLVESFSSATIVGDSPAAMSISERDINRSTFLKMSYSG